LTNSVINATKGAAKFNEKTGEFDIAALDMQKLRKIAEATGLNFEELAQSAKNAAKFASIEKQVKINTDKDTKDFISNTAFLDEKGKAQIMVGMDKKYVDALTEQDKIKLKEMAAQKKDLQGRAKETQTFDEKFKDLVTMLKVTALPIIETINNILAPKLDGLMKRFSDPKFIKGIEDFANNIREKLPIFVDKIADFGKKVIDVVEGIGKFIVDFPKKSAAIAGGIALAIGGLKWLWYGIQLGKGFNTVARAGGGAAAGGGATAAGAAGKMGKFAKFGGGAAGGALTGAINSIGAFSEGNTGEGIGNIAGGVLGGAAGALLTPVMGPLGVILGAQLGSMLGGAVGGMFDDKKGSGGGAMPVNDGVVFNPKDKFMKVNDGMMVAGTNINGNKQLAQTLASMAPTFGNKKGLMPGASNASSSSSTPVTINHKHDDITFNGTIMLETANGMSADLSKDLLKNPAFIRSISKMVHVETDKNFKGGKNSG
jgi:hypothetical protein